MNKIVKNFFSSQMNKTHLKSKKRFDNIMDGKRIAKKLVNLIQKDFHLKINVINFEIF
jgi:hypothetical protein